MHLGPLQQEAIGPSFDAPLGAVEGIRIGGDRVYEGPGSVSEVESEITQDF